MHGVFEQIAPGPDFADTGRMLPTWSRSRAIVRTRRISSSAWTSTSTSGCSTVARIQARHPAARRQAGREPPPLGPRLVEDAPHVFSKESMAREWRRGLPSDRLREVLNYVECLAGIRTTLSTSRGASGRRGTPTIADADADADADAEGQVTKDASYSGMLQIRPGSSAPSWRAESVAVRVRISPGRRSMPTWFL